MNKYVCPLKEVCMKWLFGLFLVFLLGASSASPHTITIPCDEACQEELLKNESTPAFIVDGCLLVNDEEAGDFLVCDDKDALIRSIHKSFLEESGSCSISLSGFCVAFNR